MEIKLLLNGRALVVGIATVLEDKNVHMRNRREIVVCHK